jgi:hypothetical protein
MSDGPDRCPRCGGAFRCGARDAACACAGVDLDPAIRGVIAARWDGCLCLDCLRALAYEQRRDFIPADRD